MPPAGPLFLWAMKRGRQRQGGEKVVISQVWGQLPEDDGQVSCHQDVWQPPDEPH